jgi:ligand-binding SRPBCC domain-containing protein
VGHIQISRLIPAPVEQVFDYICALENLGEWLKPQLEAEWVETPPKVREREEFEVRIARFGISMRTAARISELKPGESYTYRQTSGFFRAWSHTQSVKAHDEKSTLLTDFVDFKLPLGILGSLLDDFWLRSDIESILSHRLIAIEDHFSRQAKSPR